MTCNQLRFFPSTPQSRLLARYTFSKGFIFLHKDKGCIRPSQCVQGRCSIRMFEKSNQIINWPYHKTFIQESERINCREKRCHRNFRTEQCPCRPGGGRVVCSLFVLVICSAMHIMDISFIGWVLVAIIEPFLSAVGLHCYNGMRD